MRDMSFRTSYKLSDLINSAVEEFRANNLQFTYNDGAYNIYTKEYTETAFENLVCYLENEAIITDDDEEIYPEFVIEEKLELFYYGEKFEDVILNALHQKKDPSMDEFIQCLNYYLENDAFLDL